jgi:hypothetical protein
VGGTVGGAVGVVVSGGMSTVERSVRAISGSNAPTAFDTCSGSDASGAGFDSAVPAPIVSATTTAAVATALNRIFIPLCRFSAGSVGLPPTRYKGVKWRIALRVMLSR